MAKRFLFLISALFVLLTSLVCYAYIAYPGHCYYSIGWMYANSGDYESANKYFEKSIVILEEKHPESSMIWDAREAVEVLAEVKWYRVRHCNSLEKAVEMMEQVESPKEGEKRIMSQFMKLYAMQFEQRGEFEKAEFYYNKSKNLLDKDSPLFFKWHEDMGINLSEQKEYQKAEECFKIALGFYEKTDDLAGKARIYNAFSYINYELQNSELSMEYALKALEHLEAVKSAEMRAAILDTIACAYQLNGDYPNGEKYMRLTIQEVEGNPYFSSSCMASYYSRLGDLLQAQGDEEGARSAWDQSLMLLDKKL